MGGRFRWLQPKRVENQLSKYLNWLQFIDESRMVTKNSLILSFFAVHPHSDYFNAEEDEMAADALNNFLMTLPEGCALWYETQKAKPMASQYRDCSDMHSTERGRSFEMLRSAFFTVRSPSHVIRRYITLAFSPSFSKSAEITRDSMDDLIRIESDLIGRLSAVNIEVRRMDRDEICTYLHSCISSKHHPVKTPSGTVADISASLMDDDIEADRVPLRLGDSQIAIIALQDFPSETYAEHLSSVLSLNGTMRWVTRFIPSSVPRSKKHIDDKRRQAKSKETGGRDVIANVLFNAESDMVDTSQARNYAEAEEAMAKVGREVNFGNYSGFFVLEAKSEERLMEMMTALEKKLAAFSFIYIREELNLFPSWLSSLPGVIEANARRQNLSTGNFACLVSLTNPYQGERENAFMKKISGCDAPLAAGLLQNRSIYHLNLNGRGDVGHTFILGPTGAGKSILLSFLAISFLKYPSSRVIYFDKGLSAKKVTEGCGGKLYHPGEDETSFQPLRDAANHKEHCMRFLEAIAAVEGITLTPQEEVLMKESLSLLVPGFESLSSYSHLLKGMNHESAFVAALSNYTIGGIWGALFDSEDDGLDVDSWPQITAIELNSLMDMGNKAIIPALTYIFSRLDELFEDRRPTMLILDEAWAYLRHPVFRDRITNWLKTLRKYNVFVVMATQEVSDFDDVLGSILTNCHTKILLANSNAKTGPMAELYRRIGLTDSDVAVISNSAMMSPKRDYYIMQSEGNALVDFSLSEEELDYLR